MSDTFDPYYKWLAIPAEEQPPNHYRLLGVHLFEADPDVIESAADRQMGHVRGFATGQHSQLSQRILNEISTAKVTLLNAAKRTAYDATLRAEQAANQAAARPLPTAQSLPVAQALPVAVRTAAPELRTRSAPQPAAEKPTTDSFDIPVVTRPSSVASRRRKKSSPVLQIVGLLGVAAAIIVVAVILLKKPDATAPTGQQSTTVASSHANQNSQTTSHQTNSTTSSNPPRIDPTTKTSIDNVKSSNPKTTEIVAGSDPSPNGDDPRVDMGQGPPMGLPVIKDPNVIVDPTAGKAPVGDTGPNPDKIVAAFGEKVPGERDPFALPEPKQNPTSTDFLPAGNIGSLGSKPEPPAAELQQEKLAVIKDLFPEDYAAKTTVAKLELGKKLLETARATKDDASAVYVLLTEAAIHAAEGGSAEITGQALDMLARSFQVDLVTLYVDNFGLVLKGARSAEEHAALIRHIDKGIQAAQDADRYEDADKLMKMAQSSARVTKDPDRIKEVAASAKRLRDAQTEFDKVKSAKAKLETDPANAEANTAWGRYLCVVKNDFARGLPLLAKGSDARLKAVATADLAQPKESKEQIALGDLWYSLGDSASGTEADLLFLRAEHWYRFGVPSLSGLEKTRVEKRMKEIAQIDRSGLPRPSATLPLSSPPVAPASAGVSDRISMVGRVMADGNDMGVTVTYPLGATIDGNAVRETLQKQGLDASARVEINLGGNLLLREPTEVNFHVAGGSSSGGVCHVSINNERIASVGDDRDKDTTLARTLPAGVYLIALQITGGDLGHCLLECTTGEAKAPARFRTELLTGALRLLPTKATIDLAEPE